MDNDKYINCVYYTDGSTMPTNPGYGGIGIFGYYYKLSDKHKNIKHPVYANLFFTTEGIKPTKEDTPIEVLKIVEIIKAVNNPLTTNNESELIGFIMALERSLEIENLKSVTIYTDSNYIVSSFNENMDRWISNNWCRQDNKPIAHRDMWENIKEYKERFKLNMIDLNVVWVKSHSDNHCNNIADIYSAIGSNSSKIQYNSTSDFNENILNSELTYSEYKKSYPEKDLMLFFRELYFSSDYLDDTNYCFLSSSDNPTTIGKRDTTTIFASIIGYILPSINVIKKEFRNLKRNYISTCCIKLTKLENKEIHRLMELVNPKYLICKMIYNGRPCFHFIRDSSPFVFEIGTSYPFIVNATALFTRMLDVINEKDSELKNRYIFDITARIVKDNKIAFSNKEKQLDFSDVIEGKLNLRQKLLVSIGYDIPNYLALKNIESEIRKVNLIIDSKEDSNFCTVYVEIETTNRSLYTVNIENKFLRVK